MTLTEHFTSTVRQQKEWTFAQNNLTSNTPSKTWHRCEYGHEWHPNLDSRIFQDHKCPYCTSQTIIQTNNTITPEIAKLWHPTRNNPLKPSDITSGSNKRVWWLCEKGHEWQAKIFSLTAGSNCPYCAGKKPIVGENDLATTHPHIVNMWSPKNTIQPTELTAGSQKRIHLVCDKGHEWETSVVMFALMDCGCPYCSGKRAIPGETDLATVRPDLLAEWDLEKNTDLDPTKILPSSHEKVWWKCDRGHSWQAVMFSRTREKASGCPYCVGRKVLAGFNNLATLRPLLVKEWQTTLNGDLTPEQVSPGSNKKAWWQCPDGHVWQAYIYARTKPNGSGCPVCAGGRGCPSPPDNLGL